MDESKRCSVVSSHGPEESDILVASLEVVEWKSEVKTLSLRAVFTDHTTFIFRDGTLDDLESFLVGEKLAIPAQGTCNLKVLYFISVLKIGATCSDRQGRSGSDDARYRRVNRFAISGLHEPLPTV